MAAYRRVAEVPGKSAPELFEICSKAIHGLLDQSSTGYAFEFVPDPASLSFRLQSKPVKATLYCEDGRLRLEGELSFLLLPFRSKIDAGIDRWLNKTFGVKA